MDKSKKGIRYRRVCAGGGNDHYPLQLAVAYSEHSNRLVGYQR